MGNERVIPRWAAVVTALLAAVAAVGCGGDDGGGDASADTTEATEAPDATPAESTTTTLSPEAEVEAAVRAHDAMLIRLLQAPDPSDPEIAQRSTGSSRAEAESGLAQLGALGQHGMPGPKMSVAVLTTEISGDRATVSTCEVDDGVLIDTATGDILDDDVVTRLVTINLERVDGVWLVSSADDLETWAGVTDCA